MFFYIHIAAVIAAGFDPASVIAIIAGVGGAITGVGAVIVQHREARTKADTGYVDANLRAMQAIVDMQGAENVRLRDELEATRTRLADCERRCQECLVKISRLERRS